MAPTWKMSRSLGFRATQRAGSGFGSAMRTTTWVAVTVAVGLGCDSGRSDDQADGRPRARTAATSETAPAPVPHEVTGAEFDRQVLGVDHPVVVEFGASWCHHCRALGEVVRELAAGATRARVVTVDVDRDPALAERYGVEELPTLTVFLSGAAIGEVRGVRDRAELAPLFATLGQPMEWSAQRFALRAILDALGGASAGGSCSVQGGDPRAAASCEPSLCENC